MKIRICLLVLFAGALCQANCQTGLADIKGVTYAKNLKDWQDKSVSSLLLDIYYPTEATSDKKYPVIMFFHGGGFTGGDRANVSDGCDLFAEKGFIAVSIDYRVGYLQAPGNGKCRNDSTQSKSAIYRAMQDANAAFRFLTANANLYHIDTSLLFVGGASAGGDLAYYSSYVNDSVASIIFKGFADTLGTLQTSGNNFPYNYTLKGICGMWGGMPAMYSGQELISASYRAYPTILFKGGQDMTLPDGYGFFSGCNNYPRIISGTGIYNPLIALGVPCTYHFAPPAGHAAFDDIFCVNQAACFFKALINRTPYSGYYTYYNPSCH